MPMLNSLVDLLFANLEAGEIGSAEAAWASTWNEVQEGKGWERWLLHGKMIVARAEIALHKGDLESAANSASEAVENAVGVSRSKYESHARRLLGQALLSLGRSWEAVAELRGAVGLADSLGSPPGRWQARAALGQVLFETGDDDGAGEAYREASAVIREMAATLAPEHEKTFVSAVVQEVLRAAG